jgi:hypothetical protein
VDGVDGDAEGDGVGSALVAAQATPPAVVVTATAATVPRIRHRFSESFILLCLPNCVPG